MTHSLEKHHFITTYCSLQGRHLHYWTRLDWEHWLADQCKSSRSKMHLHYQTLLFQPFLMGNHPHWCQHGHTGGDRTQTGDHSRQNRKDHKMPLQHHLPCLASNQLEQTGSSHRTSTSVVYKRQKGCVKMAGRKTTQVHGCEWQRERGLHEKDQAKQVMYQYQFRYKDFIKWPNSITSISQSRHSTEKTSAAP